MEINFNPYLKTQNASANLYLKSQLEALGLQSTGTDNNKVSQQGENKPAPRTPEAVASFMQKLGLTPTNTKEGDNALITAKLRELEESAKNDAEKQNIAGLKSEFQSIIAQAGTIGQEHIAAFNKSFLNLK